MYIADDTSSSSNNYSCYPGCRAQIDMTVEHSGVGRCFHLRGSKNLKIN